jgi:hypothetical protein
MGREPMAMTPTPEYIYKQDGIWFITPRYIEPKQEYQEQEDITSLLYGIPRYVWYIVTTVLVGIVLESLVYVLK